MKKKTLLLLLFLLLFGSSLSSKNLYTVCFFQDLNFNLASKLISSVSIKKEIMNFSFARSSKTLVNLAPPQTTAGSSCGNGVNPVQINVYAFGVNGNETIEWFISQSSSIPIFTGNVYSPSISTTRTYYVQSRLGNDFSTRVPVVASVYLVPPAVTLTASPANNPSFPLCLGTSVTFTATGGGDLFEFSVDGVVKQAMSTNKMFVTNALTDGQVVRVRTRFAVIFDGNITEKAWGTGPLEDNFMSVPLSVNSTTGYINSLKISSTEDKLVFGIAGKSLRNRRILLFLDTKIGGFNVSNFGDEAGYNPLVNAFNFFNNSLNTFDSYFQADYCLVIGTDTGETNYISDIIELKTGTSIKTNLGNAATGFPSSFMGVNKNNTSINDYNLGFEVEISKSLLGYTTGDIKFFAMTMADQDETNFVVTNSFLSPERTSSLDYGNGAVDYNLKDSNPVVVSAAALTPCYSEANSMVNFVSVPKLANVVQPNCAVPSGSITITTESGVEYSLNGTTYQASNTFSGLAPNSYTLYVRNTADVTCVTKSSSSITINPAPNPPIVPTTTNVVQPTCGTPSGSISITTQSGIEYSLNGTTYQASNTFSGLTPNSYTLYVRNTDDVTCVTQSATPITINAIPTAPLVPTTASMVQPTCAVPSGSISITTQSGVEYSLNGTTYQTSNTFSGLTPNNYILYVRKTADGTCIAQSASAITINAIQIILTPIAASLVQPTCAIPTSSIVIIPQLGVEYSLNGITYQASNTFTGLPPNSYTLYVRSTIDATCIKSSVSMVTINIIPTFPVVPTITTVVQPTCAVPSGSIVIAPQSGVEYSLNGTVYQASNSFTGLAPNTYTLYVRNSADPTCSVQSSVKVVVDPLPALPTIPTLVKVIQPTCLVPSGTIEIATQVNVQYSIGNVYQDSAIFTNLIPGKYTISVRFPNSIACVMSGSVQTINAIPPQIIFETFGDCENKEYTLTANPISGTYDPNNLSYQWKDKFGNPVGTNSNVLNVTNVIASSPNGQVEFPIQYTLTVTSINTGCETSGNVVVESIYCNLQKGISPDGNGSNDFFDLRLMNVKKLEVFNRYGIREYSQSNYTDQWKGQSSKGEQLPSATYYYVIEFNSGEPKTGWIYLIREKQ